MCEVLIASLNLNGARERNKRAIVFETFKQKRVDVAFVQETHTDTRNGDDWASEFPGVTVLSHNTSNSGGVGILFGPNFIPCSYDCDEIIKGRLLKVRAYYECKTFVFVCVYAPTNAIERMLFLHTLDDVLKTCHVEDVLVVGGDFNCTETALDRNHIEPHMPSRRKLIEVLKLHNIVDVWRNFHLNQRQYTWVHAYSNMLSLARLDRFYGFKHQLNFFRSCNIVPVGFSDHCMITCKIFISTFKPKSAYWHFNTSLLQDNHFRDVFRFFWDQFKTTKHAFKSIQQWWDFAKVQIKILSQQYSFNVTRDIKKRMAALENEILNLQKDTNGNVMEKLKTKKNLLSELLGVKAQGALVRSRFQSIELMDAPTKFFFNLEKKNGQKKLMQSLLSEDGALLYSHTDIRRRARIFFENLYKSEISYEQAPENAFLNNLPQMSSSANTILGGVITLEEVFIALQSMESGRAPGIDGLPVAFYKVFWPEIGADLLEVLGDSLTNGCLPQSCRRAVVTLLPKKGDLNDIKSWRPVSVLCVEYKILSKVLANRLSKVVGEVIHPDQSYCVPGRLIYDNICFIRDIVDVGRRLNLDFGLVSIDNQKAFDRIEHNYLWNVLAAFGLKSDFINYVKVLYRDIESILKVNGDLCAPFKVFRGIRQGCPLSGMLYSLAIEPLLIKLRNEVEGVMLPNCTFKFQLSAYADDVAILVKSQRDVDVMLQLFNDFKKLSSNNVNWGKSVALLMGEWKNGSPRLPDDLHWCRDGFKYLGVCIGNDEFMLNNFEGVLEKVKGRLSRWNFLMNKLSYRGRVLIINNLVASSLWHRLACIDPPVNVLSKIQSVLVNFFWDSLHWVPQSVLFLPREEGGHGLIHLQSRTAAFRLQFIQRLLCGTVSSSWKAVACAILRTFEGLGLDRTLFWMDPKHLNLNRFPIFYRNLFKVWTLFKIGRTVNSTSLFWILQEPLIYGSILDLSHEQSFPALTKILCEAKVLTLNDLLNLAGPALQNADPVANQLGIRSSRVIERLLGKWEGLLTEEDKRLLNDFSMGLMSPNDSDVFPNFTLSANLDDCSGVFLQSEPLSFLGCNLASGKALYKLCVLVMNKKNLDKRIDTPWRAVLQITEEVKPQWRVFHKSPLPKKYGDLQWRILHGAVAVNAFISVLNPSVSEQCPFCTMRETIFHAFMQCVRLEPLFSLLKRLFGGFNENFSMESFIFGIKYCQKRKSKCLLLNFLLGQSKMAIYVSRRNKVEFDSGYNIVKVFMTLLKSRILVDFHFYSEINDLGSFKKIWCYKSVVCYVEHDTLSFNSLLEDLQPD